MSCTTEKVYLQTKSLDFGETLKRENEKCALATKIKRSHHLRLHHRNLKSE